MKVVLLGLEFYINNLGCEALSYAFVSELYKLVQEKGRTIELVSFVFADKKNPNIPGTEQKIKCSGIHYKSYGFWKGLVNELRSSDIIVDFTMGDSFSDIYGIKRFALDAIVKTIAVKTGTPFILGPQTYGPYKNIFLKQWAKWIISKAYKVYTRDDKSKRVAETLSKREVVLTTDVAFALTYKEQEIGSKEKIKVGINPSGLLWGGGYTHNNQFGLKIDYQKYCWDICEMLSHDSKYEIYLIPHVGTKAEKGEKGENDFNVCKLLQAKYSEMKILNNVSTPMNIKGYIAAMDVFIGARMHATIAAFSSGVATIPVSYSRKFEGLYGSLQYNYVIHALQYTTEEAVDKTMEYIAKYQQIKTDVKKSMILVKQKQDIFSKSLGEIIEKIKE